MKTQLENIYISAKEDITKAQSINDIDEIRLKYLSRKGEFNSIKKGLKDLSDEDKRTSPSAPGRSETKSPTELEAPGCDRHTPGPSGPPGDHMGGWGFLAVC